MIYLHKNTPMDILSRHLPVAPVLDGEEISVESLEKTMDSAGLVQVLVITGLAIPRMISHRGVGRWG